MKRYRVAFAATAMEDIVSSYEWGCREWGEEAAWRWYENLRDSVRRMLASFPLSQAIAPDNDSYQFDTRQMLVGRYRFLFTVQGETVTVFHVRGPFTK